MELLKTIQDILKCDILSELRFEPYNSQAKEILTHISLKGYSEFDIYNAFEYIFSSLGE